MHGLRGRVTMRRNLAGQPPREKKKSELSLDSVTEAYRNIPRVFYLVWHANWRATLIMAGITLVSGLIPVTQAWVGKLIVDAVVNALKVGLDPMVALRLALPYVLLEFVILLTSQILSQSRNLAEHVLNARLSLYINTQIIEKALSLDLSYFEDPQFYDQLQNARREADFRSLQIVNGVFSLIQSTITLSSFALILIAFNPFIALLLFAAAIPSFIAQSRYARLTFRVLSWRAPEARRMAYLEHILTVDESVKEVKLFGLGAPLLKAYTALVEKAIKEDQEIAVKRSFASIGWGLLATLSYYVAYLWIIFRTVSGAITLGDMTLYLSVFRQSQQTFRGLFDGLSSLYENALFISNLFSFLALRPRMPVQTDARPVPEHMTGGIEFRDVSFRYDGREDWALRHVNLHIRPGEKLALVGANGAGKTTLIKLLTRLYDPTEGVILLDGVDLREYKVEELHQKIGVIFQDFVRYQATARDNVAYGQIEALGDTARILEAAQRSGAAPVLEGLPEGYDTMLGRWFQGGHDLSGGEWQKVALSRAFMRDSEVLVLDEPTAALDAENEALVFARFRELTTGRTAVLISHRFSTVRIADRIAVIADGRIAELGSHEELIALDGTYARLFNLQAAGYR
ncbi:MAG: ABC transporter ATP-binding protein [Anaerolineae bacterium]